MPTSLEGKQTSGQYPDIGHIFNDDLLMNPGDLKHASQQYPLIFHVFDNPELRKAFKECEKQANTSRNWARCVGLAAVLFSLLALVSVASAPLREKVFEGSGVASRFDTVAIIAEVAGFVGALVAAGGLWSFHLKRRWLVNRLKSERLRQWHFHMLLRRPAEIEASCNNGDPDAQSRFRELRVEWLKDFLHGMRGKLDSKLGTLTQPDARSEFWTIPKNGEWSPGSPVLSQVTRAYRQLRLVHQYEYALHKLQPTADVPFFRFLKRSPVVQQKMIVDAWSFSFFSAILASIWVIAGHVNNDWSGPPYLAATAAVVLGILAITLNVIGDGLKLNDDIERYSEYRDKIHLLLHDFDIAQDDSERLRVMEELEVEAFDEMCGFLRSQDRAFFVL